MRKKQINDARFRRQHAFEPYITDFCSPRAKLIIELDGSQHLDQQEYDQTRTEYLQEKGCKVLRFWNSNMANKINGVIQAIMNELDENLPLPNPPHYLKIK